MEFTLDAFREQMRQIGRLGSLQEIMGKNTAHCPDYAGIPLAPTRYTEGHDPHATSEDIQPSNAAALFRWP